MSKIIFNRAGLRIDDDVERSRCLIINEMPCSLEFLKALGEQETEDGLKGYVVMCLNNKNKKIEFQKSNWHWTLFLLKKSGVIWFLLGFLLSLLFIAGCSSGNIPETAVKNISNSSEKLETPKNDKILGSGYDNVYGAYKKVDSLQILRNLNNYLRGELKILNEDLEDCNKENIRLMRKEKNNVPNDIKKEKNNVVRIFDDNRKMTASELNSNWVTIDSVLCEMKKANKNKIDTVIISKPAFNKDNIWFWLMIVGIILEIIFFFLFVIKKNNGLNKSIQ